MTFPLHKGLSKEESLMIDENNTKKSMIEDIKSSDLSELSYDDVKMIHDLTKKDYSCHECGKKDTTIEDVAYEFDFMCDNLRSEFNDFSDKLPRNNKQLIEDFNKFLKKIKEEIKKRQTNITKFSKYDFEYEFDPDKLSYYPDME